ncbi:hypothetical protein EXU85_06045 [Spirosoma sp. KCTC 42546]|uniref:hypothetical protein n=1 Tax=Spirosoma sp. KCTC 42546 TaxID=2520506 RepID=UPI001158139A|nr:hypothetical protein [Spirosoma sp. KCTC 42546]QDK78181.1 hypothetical protein EXU85_06045 [Spirosoma sp. KCTC 42546]
MRSLTIQIPQPCHERWDDMQPTERGRFCASCQKTVVDYTALSDQELVRLLSKAPETSCGRFRNEQLNRQLVVANPGIASVWRHWVGLLTMGLFGWQTARAQLNQAPKPSQPTSVRPDFAVSAIPVQAIDAEKKWVITGRIMLLDTSGRLSPASGVTLSASQFVEHWQTQTDSTGAFELVVTSQKQLTELTVWTYTQGYLPGRATIPITTSTSLITLNDIILREPRPLKNITGGGLVTIKSPSRWQRLKRALFH